MLNVRRLLIPALAAALFGCGPAEHAGLAPDVRRELESGAAAASGWLALERGGAVPPDEAVIGLGYLERLRLGLGSPFRLVEAALRDPRLSEQVQRQVGWALLARTLAGDAYEIDPIVLDRAGMAGIPNWPGLGRHHLRLIESTITEARDPRSGELAVRLAYRVATMEGSLPALAPEAAIRVAALVRDREVARADVARLLRSAQLGQGDPLTAVARWRSERWLAVEAPALGSVSDAVEREALELAPRLTQALRMLGPRIGDVTRLRATGPDVNPSLLTPATARRLAAIADSTAMPPRAPIAVGTRTYREEMLRHPWLSDTERQRRQQLMQIGTEERLVAQLAQLERSSPHDAVPSLTAVWTAVALRTFAQEAVWFPGFGGPTNRELEERFGLASVRFSDDVPAEWRPYYRGVLELALQDMQRVLPALDVRGLSIRYGAVRRGEGTLAMHDPRMRELVLPPGSAAGTLAHEIAHDLDWQVALRRYRVRGDYASDRASRSANDRLAVRVRHLASDAAAEAAATERLHAHAQRPAENFARAVDWFVVSALAAQGRTNGFLSSIQDDVLTGYGTVRPPDITGRAGDALINIFDEVAPLYPETRGWFLKQYGTSRSLTAGDLVRVFAELDLPAPSAPGSALAGVGNPAISGAFSHIARTRERAAQAVDEWICRGAGSTREPQLERARRLLIGEAAAARARGVALQHARRLGGEDGARWVARRLYGGPWPSQALPEGMEELLAPLVDAVHAASQLEPATGAGRFELHQAAARCESVARFS